MPFPSALMWSKCHIISLLNRIMHMIEPNGSLTLNILKRNPQKIAKNGVVHSNAYSIFICELIVSKIGNFGGKYFVFNVMWLFTLKTMLHTRDYELITL